MHCQATCADSHNKEILRYGGFYTREITIKIVGKDTVVRSRKRTSMQTI
jgi:hypothetical protein